MVQELSPNYCDFTIDNIHYRIKDVFIEKKWDVSTDMYDVDVREFGYLQIVLVLSPDGSSQKDYYNGWYLELEGIGKLYSYPSRKGVCSRDLHEDSVTQHYTINVMKDSVKINSFELYEINGVKTEN